MSRGFSGGKIADARNRGRVCLFWTTENEDDNGSLWVKVTIVSSLDAVATLQQTIMT